MPNEELTDVKDKKAKSSYLNKLTRISPGANFILLVLLVLTAVVVIIPMLLVVIISFSTPESISLKGYSFTPTSWTNSAYEMLLGKGLGTQILQSYILTIAQALLGTVLSIFVMSLYAYVLAQKRFPCRKFYTIILFITMLFSGGLVPSYIVNTRYLHLYNSFWIFIFPGLVAAYSIIVLRTFINTTIPDAMFDAARIDGANDFMIYAKIVMPLFKAGLAVTALWALVGRWNDWFTATLYIENPKLVPLQTMLVRIQKNLDFIKNNSALRSSPSAQQMLKSLPGENIRMAIVIISIVPILFAYPFFQRYFVKGITVGSVKG